MPRTLYEITEDVLKLNELLDEVEGDLGRCGEIEPAITAWLISLGVEQEKKLDGYAGLILQLEMEAVAAKAEAEQWQAKARSRESRVKFLKERLKQHLTLTGQTKVTTASGRLIKVQSNGGQKPIIYADEIDLNTAPEDHVIVRRDLDRAKVRETLESGGTLPFAVLAERGPQLRIR